jgi:hypothetical protein
MGQFTFVTVSAGIGTLDQETLQYQMEPAIPCYELGTGHQIDGAFIPSVVIQSLKALMIAISHRFSLYNVKKNLEGLTWISAVNSKNIISLPYLQQSLESLNVKKLYFCLKIAGTVVIHW